jgi:hypothetical protein
MLALVEPAIDVWVPVHDAPPSSPFAESRPEREHPQAREARLRAPPASELGLRIPPDIS